MNKIINTSDSVNINDTTSKSFTNFFTLNEGKLFTNVFDYEKINNLPITTTHIYVDWNQDLIYNKYAINFDNSDNLDKIFNSIELEYKKKSQTIYEISKCGDLCKKVYLNIQLPPFEPIPNITFPINLQVLFIKSDMFAHVQTIKLDMMPMLTELYIISYKFNSNITFDLTCESKLKLVSITSSIFNSSHIMSNLPPNLEYLYLNSVEFNIELNNLPSKLKVLSIVSEKFSSELSNLPVGLKILHIKSPSFNSSLDYLPESLEYLYLDNYCYTPHYSNHKFQNLPVGLKKIFINKIQTNILDLTTKQLTQFETESITQYFNSSECDFGKKITIQIV